MKLLLLILAGMFISGCASGHYFTYDTRPPMDTSIEIKNDTLSSDATLGKDRISIAITNNFSSPLKIVWDDASIVVAGQASKVVHIGVRYEDFQKAMPPVTIPPHSTFSDEVVQPDHVFPLGVEDKWFNVGVLPQYDRGKTENARYNLSLEGKSVSLFLPVQIEGVEHFYEFRWNIDSVKYRELGLGD